MGTKQENKKVSKKASNIANQIIKNKQNSSKSTSKNNSAIASIKRPFHERKLPITMAVILLVITIVTSSVALVLAKERKAHNIPFVNAYATTASHGYATKTIGTIARNIPTEVKDEGLACGYPKWGYTKSLSTDEKNQILRENSYLNTGTYNKLDADGYLYLSDGTPALDANSNPRKLYKHTGAVGLYLGDVSDSEPAVIKQITFSPRRGPRGYNVTGLYAPAGEVVKLEISEQDFISIGKNLTIYIGQALYNGQANNIWAAKNFNRMPVILNTFTFNEANSTYNEKTKTYTCYVGSYFGGPIYIRNVSKRYTITISGAVNYRHFILGQTTKQEFEELSKSTAPYFDLEVWDNGVLHSGPLYYVRNYTYDDLYNAAILWEKISLTSTQVSSQGIVMIYDCFVAAGAAVAFPGRSSTNCPVGWFTNALNYNGFITSGAWGVIHEYNHNFQGWGLPGGGEVTNNALNLASYVSFTKISSNRTLTASGEGGISDWNAYTSASWALNRTLNNLSSTNQLVVYATLLHNIGAKNFVLGAKGSGVTNYFNNLCSATGYDLSYYFTNIINQNPGQAALDNVANLNLPKLIPVASVYQTGRSIIENGKKTYIETMQPFVFNYGEKLQVDLRPYTLTSGLYDYGTIHLPSGFSYKIKKVTSPAHGTLVKKQTNVYEYTPSTNLRSGKIYVTLEITKDDNAFKVEDVDLVLEFEQTHEKNKAILERSVYTYNSNIYQTATQAYEAKYAGYTSKTDENNINSTQNSNTDIWVPNPNNNAVMEVRGKFYIASDGAYRIALRGRHHCALYISTDNGKTYTLGAKLNHNTNKNDWWLDTTAWGTETIGYVDVQNLKAGAWVYFKEVLLVDYNASFIGLGFGKLEIQSAILDEDGNLVDGNGNKINESDLTYTANLSYASAYRPTYQFHNAKFESNYLFTRNWRYTLDASKYYNTKGTLVSFSGYKEWPNAGYSPTINELFDDDDSNYIHSAKGINYDITPSNPFEMVVDLGSAISATRMTIYGESSRLYLPKDFTLYAGTTLNNLKKVISITNATKTGNDIVTNFNETSFRYYKFVCTKTMVYDNPDGSKYIAFRCIKFSRPLVLSGCTHLVPDSKEINYVGASWQIKNQISTFGRIYEGAKRDSLIFNFTGTYFAIFSYKSKTYGKFQVYIDDALIETINLNGQENTTSLAYVSKKLTNTNHTIKLVGIDKFNIDSILLYKP